MSSLMSPNVFLGDSKQCIPFRPSASQLLKRDERLMCCMFPLIYTPFKMGIFPKILETYKAPQA